MSLFIKICGLTDPEALMAAVQEGANAIGFNFHPPSPRCLTPERAEDLAALVPHKVLRVAVMLRPEQADLEEVLAGFKADCLQADADCLARLQLPVGVQSLPVYRDEDRFNAEHIATETPCLFEGAVSGQGRMPSWEHAAMAARRGRVLLAGGLDPQNVAEAVRRVRPWGVDVSSGVERAPGVKDPGRVREFIRAARRADLSR